MEKGTVKIIENFYMPQLVRHRTLRIYLPPEYYKSEDKYPVLYMHDAQNLFDIFSSSFGTIWDIANTMDRLYLEGRNKGCIVVGIDNEGEFRYEEYSPWRNEEIYNLMPFVKDTGRPGGKGYEYIDFIVHNLKPYIDANFRTLPTRENTAISGSSMGGFISLSAAIKYQEVFSKVAAFSSAIFFSQEDLRKLIRNTGKKHNMKIYMDIGTKETSNDLIQEFPQIYLQSNIAVYEELKKAGFSENELQFVIDEGGIHNESEWCKRFPGMIEWIFQ